MIKSNFANIEVLRQFTELHGFEKTSDLLDVFDLIVANVQQKEKFKGAVKKGIPKKMPLRVNNRTFRYDLVIHINQSSIAIILHNAQKSGGAKK